MQRGGGRARNSSCPIIIAISQYQDRDCRSAQRPAQHDHRPSLVSRAPDEVRFRDSAGVRILRFNVISIAPTLPVWVAMFVSSHNVVARSMNPIWMGRTRGRLGAEGAQRREEKWEAKAGGKLRQGCVPRKPSSLTSLVVPTPPHRTLAGIGDGGGVRLAELQALSTSC